MNTSTNHIVTVDTYTDDLLIITNVKTKAKILKQIPKGFKIRHQSEMNKSEMKLQQAFEHEHEGNWHN